MEKVTVRKGQGSVALSRDEFARRFRERFYDPAFDGLAGELDRVIAVAWDGYKAYRKSPQKRKAGPGFANPEYELPIEWLDTRERILDAARMQADRGSRSRILLVSGAARHDQTCPGEMSKTFRMVQLAREEIERAETTCDLLDLSLLTAEYGRQILPCKACVSTAMPLCHLVDMKLIPAAPSASIDRYVGYYEPYATSHDALDRDEALQAEVRNVAKTLVEAVTLMRNGRLPKPDEGVPDPRPK